jgi:predicted peptidase
MRLSALAILALLGRPVLGQQVQTGFLNRTVTVGGRVSRYQVYVPGDYTTSTAWPVILFLHGAGERGSDGLRQTSVGLAPANRNDPTRFPAIVVFPQVPDDSQWVGMPADVAMTALRQTQAEFHTDPDRVYLTGLSMGGHGTWYLAYRNPDVFAAVVPICGWVVDIPQFRGSVPVVPGDSGTPIPALARRLRQVPIWIFHGEVDRVVPVAGSREPAAALKDVGADVRYTEFLGLDHDSWDATYASKAFVDWLFAQRRHGR